METFEGRRNVNSEDRRREKLRDQLWPGSGEWIWTMNDRGVVGFATMSRLTSLLMFLIKQLSGGKNTGNPAMVFLDLWCYDRGQGLVVIDDEEVRAYACGYDSGRGLRTWRNHMLKLQELGFILVKPKGTREFGHILLLNPLAVAARHHAEGRVDENWWDNFVAAASAIKATILPPLELPKQGKRAVRAAPAHNSQAGGQG
jgi:hypothetical protein